MIIKSYSVLNTVYFSTDRGNFIVNNELEAKKLIKSLNKRIVIDDNKTLKDFIIAFNNDYHSRFI